MKRTYRCVIKVVSPLHVGCDETYEPMGFVLDEQANQLIVFDPVSFVRRMNPADRQRFGQICAKGTIASILEIYKFLRNRRAEGKTVSLCSGFTAHYNKVLNLPLNDTRKLQSQLNSFTISRTAFLASDSRPYIPGSSVKGALRTAFLNRIAKNRPTPTLEDKKAAMELEKKLLDYNSIPTDPFRMVKVSDFMPVGEIRTRILYAVNVKKASGGEGRGPFQILEAVMPGALFQGEITVEQPIDKRAIKSPIKLDSLLDSCRFFYVGEFQRERQELITAGVSPIELSLDGKNLPVRIGRHCGAESVTIKGHRRIKIMGQRGRGPSFKDHATTLWLAAEESKPKDPHRLVPFGWCELIEMDAALEQDLEKRERQCAKKTPEESPGLAAGLRMDAGVATAEETSQPKPPPELETWENARLSFAPNTGEIAARLEEKTAITKDQALIPEAILDKLKKKKRKKPVVATVRAEHIGGRNYRIVEIKQDGGG